MMNDDGDGGSFKEVVIKGTPAPSIHSKKGIKNTAAASKSKKGNKTGSKKGNKTFPRTVIEQPCFVAAMHC